MTEAEIEKQIDELLFRCSALGRLMTDDRSGNKMGDTAKTLCDEVYIKLTTGREKVIETKYFSKGNIMEEDALTLLSLDEEIMFKKNTICLSNDYISGTPDTYLGESIYKADRIYDTKCSWDIFTHYPKRRQPIDKKNEWQMHGYLWLTGASIATVDNCLVDTPKHLIYSAKLKLAYDMGVIDELTNPLYILECEKIDLLSYYDDIPNKNKNIKFDVLRDEFKIERIIERVIEARLFIKTELHKKLK